MYLLLLILFKIIKDRTIRTILLNIIYFYKFLLNYF